MAAMHKRVWGRGDPVIALHPLGLESSGFGGFGKALAKRGMRTVAVDLPGFGRTPAPEGPLTPVTLAEPVIAMARRMKTKPAVLGISLGGRVALEAAMLDPDAFRSVTAIAPYVPWRRYRIFVEFARLLGPGLADWLPMERFWPQLKSLADTLVTNPYVRDDELAQAAARFVYFLSCPATRANFFAAARGLALDPAFGEDGFWTRLPELKIPVAFAWGEKDGLIWSSWAGEVREALPSAAHIVLPCASHVLNGPHHCCIAEAVADLLDGPLHAESTYARTARGRRAVGDATDIETIGCLVDGSREPAMAESRRAA